MKRKTNYIEKEDSKEFYSDGPTLEDKIFSNVVKDEESAEYYFDLAEKARDEDNYKEAIVNYELAAALGDGLSCNNLGTIYFNGLGVEKNPEKALKYYLLAIDRGIYYAAINTINLCVKCEEILTNENINSIYNTLMRAYDGKNKNICYALGVMYHNDYIGNEDVLLEIKYFEEAMKNGFADNYFLALNYIYVYKDGVSLNLDKGLNILEDLSDKGDYDSTVDLAYYYYDKDTELFNKYLDRCFEYGHSDAFEKIEAKYRGEKVNIYK